MPAALSRSAFVLFPVIFFFAYYFTPHSKCVRWIARGPRLCVCVLMCKYRLRDYWKKMCNWSHMFYFHLCSALVFFSWMSLEEAADANKLLNFPRKFLLCARGCVFVSLPWKSVSRREGVIFLSDCLVARCDGEARAKSENRRLINDNLWSLNNCS